MLKKLIAIEKGESYQYDTLEDLVKDLIDKNFYNMEQNEKVEIMQRKAIANSYSLLDDIEKKSKIIDKIEDEWTYILYLLTTNNVVLLEHKESEIFTKDINKKELKDNYIIINSFAEELLNKKIEKK